MRYPMPLSRRWARCCQGGTQGRRSNEEIMIFDSSGLSVQDLYIARHLLAVPNGSFSH